MKEGEMMDRCHYEDGVFIPFCWGGLLHGKQGCYCKPKDDRTMIEKKIDDLQQQINNLKKQINNLKKRLNNGLTKRFTDKCFSSTKL